MIPGGVEPTIVEVVTPWCGACRSMRSDIAATAAAHADRVEFVVVDATETPEIARRLAVTATPTLIGFNNGTEVFRVLGRRTRADLEQMFADVSSAPEGQATPMRRADRVLRVSAGLVLIAIGGLAGPAWPLFALGTVITGWGLRT